MALSAVPRTFAATAPVFCTILNAFCATVALVVATAFDNVSLFKFLKDATIFFILFGIFFNVEAKFEKDDFTPSIIEENLEVAFPFSSVDCLNKLSLSSTLLTALLYVWKYAPIPSPVASCFSSFCKPLRTDINDIILLMDSSISFVSPNKLLIPLPTEAAAASPSN